MRSWKKPTREQLLRAIALLGRVEQYRYFFDRLDNPTWITPLFQEGFFKNPLSPTRDDRAGTIRFPPWPESRYLARMAATAPEEVLGVLLALPDTDNILVHQDVVEAALAMPAGLAARLVPKARAWPLAPYASLLPDRLGKLVGHLASGGETEEALDLARALLAVVPADSGRPEAKARFDDWQYGEVLKADLPKLVSAAGVKAVELLCNLLQWAVRFSLSPGSTPPCDHSEVWCPTVEEETDEQRQGALHRLLVRAVAQAASQSVREGTASVPEVIRVLEVQPWMIFRRLGLWLLSEYPTEAFDLVAGRLSDRPAFDERALRHEYSLLLKAGFCHMGRDVQDLILAWVNEGPYIPAYQEGFQSSVGHAPDAQQIDRHKKVWQRDRLSWFGDALPPEWKVRYEALVAELGEPEHADRAFYVTSGWAGPMSPVGRDALAGMSIADITQLLRTWRPSGRMMEPSAEGLGRDLTAVVAAEPERFAEEATTFQDLEATYVRSLLRGFEEAVREEKRFAWPGVLGLCKWVVDQGVSIPGRSEERANFDDFDQSWRGTRAQVAALLAAGFQVGPCAIPFDLRFDAWAPLESLTPDTEPTPEYEARYGGSNTDPATLSLNVVRGQAIHTVFRYALWVRRHLDQASASGGSAPGDPSTICLKSGPSWITTWTVQTTPQPLSDRCTGSGSPGWRIWTLTGQRRMYRPCFPKRHLWPTYGVRRGMH